MNGFALAKPLNFCIMNYKTMPAGYLATLEKINPFFAFDARLHIANVGVIVVYPEINAYFGCYEPISNEAELFEAYDDIKRRK